jgi:hypothetical protein
MKLFYIVDTQHNTPLTKREDGEIRYYSSKKKAKKQRTFHNKKSGCIERTADEDGKVTFSSTYRYQIRRGTDHIHGRTR